MLEPSGASSRSGSASSRSKASAGSRRAVGTRHDAHASRDRRLRRAPRWTPTARPALVGSVRARPGSARRYSATCPATVSMATDRAANGCSKPSDSGRECPFGRRPALYVPRLVLRPQMDITRSIEHRMEDGHDTHGAGRGQIRVLCAATASFGHAVNEPVTPRELRTSRPRTRTELVVVRREHHSGPETDRFCHARTDSDETIRPFSTLTRSVSLLSKRSI